MPITQRIYAAYYKPLSYGNVVVVSMLSIAPPPTMRKAENLKSILRLKTPGLTPLVGVMRKLSMMYALAHTARPRQGYTHVKPPSTAMF